jgi:hypothetical protein
MVATHSAEGGSGISPDTNTNSQACAHELIHHDYKATAEGRTVIITDTTQHTHKHAHDCNATAEGGKGAGAAAQPYQQKKGGQRIGFATADDEMEDGGARPYTGATEDSMGGDTESRVASRFVCARVLARVYQR